MEEQSYPGSIDESWSFEGIDRRQTSYISHSYHRYPAKFIPQLVSRLIRENSEKQDLVCDPFVGSGTTLVESLVNRRRSYGSDINPVAVLISKAKTTAIDPNLLKKEISHLLNKIKLEIRYVSERGEELSSGIIENSIPNNKRIDYWFPTRQKTDLAIILSSIKCIECENIQKFLL
jgi:adenine-specific DNA methylase